MNALYILAAITFWLFVCFVVEQIILYTVLYSLYRRIVPIRCAGGMNESVSQTL